jgi:hypothetical protein
VITLLPKGVTRQFAWDEFYWLADLNGNRANKWVQICYACGHTELVVAPTRPLTCQCGAAQILPAIEA